ncbi:hypothetical protein [Neptuniibacter sp. QD37_11]|uniref:hypothetical protein n=1 Tax=Neptuniibacter sp. QD37_11 TaxID=3398209 RepID=UPI0039F4FF62
MLLKRIPTFIYVLAVLALIISFIFHYESPEQVRERDGKKLIHFPISEPLLSRLKEDHKKRNQANAENTTIVERVSILPPVVENTNAHIKILTSNGEDQIHTYLDHCSIKGHKLLWKMQDENINLKTNTWDIWIAKEARIAYSYPTFKKCLDQVMIFTNRYLINETIKYSPSEQNNLASWETHIGNTTKK